MQILYQLVGEVVPRRSVISGSIPVTGTLARSPFDETRGNCRDESPSRGACWSTVWSTVALAAPRRPSEAQWDSWGCTPHIDEQ